MHLVNLDGDLPLHQQSTSDTHQMHRVSQPITVWNSIVCNQGKIKKKRIYGLSKEILDSKIKTKKRKEEIS
jgi:hypothetical protein